MENEHIHVCDDIEAVGSERLIGWLRAVENPELRTSLTDHVALCPRCSRIHRRAISLVPAKVPADERSWLGWVLKPLSEWMLGPAVPNPVSGPAKAENEQVEEWSLKVGRPDDMNPAELHLVIGKAALATDAFVEVRAENPDAVYLVRASVDGEDLFEEELKVNERVCVENAEKLGPDTRIEVIELK